MKLAADCGRCEALCCVAPAFARSAEFAIDKPAGRPCPNLRGSACGIHDRLPGRGFGGCVAYDCYGAGQQVVQVVFGGGGRSPRMLRAYEVARQLHELLFYLADALEREAARDTGPALAAGLAAARDSIERVMRADPATVEAADPGAYRATVAPLLRRVSALSRARPYRDLAGQDMTGRDLAGAHPTGPDFAGADLTGRDFAAADLRRADLSTAYLLGADLRGADLRLADVLGADLRGADLRGADLRDALYLTRTQVGGARTNAGTRLPAALRD